MQCPRHSWVSVILFALLLTQSRAAAPASVPEDIRLPFTEHTLKNGMRFLIVERHDSPPSPATSASRWEAPTRRPSSPGWRTCWST